MVVEVAVRNASGLLADADANAGADGGEQEAAAALFAGAMGAYKNPASHRTIVSTSTTPSRQGHSPSIGVGTHGSSRPPRAPPTSRTTGHPVDSHTGSGCP